MGKGFKLPHWADGYLKNKFARAILIIIIIIILTLPFNIINLPESSQDFIFSNSGSAATSNPSRSEESATESNYTWQLVKEIEETVEINKGSDFFVKVSPRAEEGEKLQIKKQLDYTEFLSETAVSAIGEAPNWLRNDLTEKFIDLAQIDILLTSETKVSFGDLDVDGDLDAICSADSDKLIYFENKGTAYEPLYVRDDKLFNKINDYNFFSAEICLGDVDADNDLDLLVGDMSGIIHLIENTGGPDSPDYTYYDIIVIGLSGRASPCLGDLDADGDLDLVTGSADGRIYYYVNTGTPQNHSWTANIASSFSSIDVGDRSRPTLADLDNDGDLDLTIGEEDDNLNFYRNTGSSYSSSWRSEASMYFGLPVEPHTSPELVDINGDSKLDLIVGGDNRGFYRYDNIGTATGPQWQVWSSYKVFPGIEYYDTISYLKYINNSWVDIYAQLILDADNKYKDEVAFSIAHTPTQVLIQTSDNPVYRKNAELLYEIDQYLDYANIIDYGSYASGDYYSTVSYKYKTSATGTIQTTELPKDIYYWNIVHPKISDEIPDYINPETGEPAAPPLGRFWREYLFYHNDTEYPQDPPTDINDDGIPDYHYPKDAAPPLLKERLAGIEYVYDSQPYDAPNGYQNDGFNNSRPWGYKDHAIEALSNWVCKTLTLNEQESADGERPIQPVRISRHHNGNCGELQDLTIAASRTALIPAVGVMLWGEDHVWNEFYERGWHQWDNYWSDGGSVVDNSMNYWVGWNQRGGSGISKWHGDDSVSDVTHQYVPEQDLSTLVIHVEDRDGNPVDGARVMVGSYWTSLDMSGYQVTIPFPSVWNYTDNNGISLFRVATQEGMADGNKNFSFKIISKIGNAEQAKTELEHGEDYEFWFNLEGRVPETGLDTYTIPYPESNDRFKAEIYFELQDLHQFPPNPWVGNYHPQAIPSTNCLLGFICNETNLNYYYGSSYRTVNPVQNLFYTGYCQVGNITFETFNNENLYFVLYNKNTIETSITITIRARLYEKPDADPEVSIVEPKSYETFEIGTEVLIKGYARDDRGIKVLRLSIGAERYYITGSSSNDTWEYLWNTSTYKNGTYFIKIVAYDTNDNYETDFIYIDLEPAPPPPPPPPGDITPPSIEIRAPINGTIFTIGDQVNVKGTAEDDIELSDLSLSLNSKSIDLMPFLNGTNWSYRWISEGKDAGEYKFYVRGTDGVGNLTREYGYFILKEVFQDFEPPEITITKPSPDQSFGLGETVIFEGLIEDNVGVGSFLINIDSQQWVDISNSMTGSGWVYVWPTVGIEVGWHTVNLYASDISGNTDEHSQSVILVDETPPEISITSPKYGTELSPGTNIKIRGYCSDEVGIDILRLTISGVDVTEKIKKGIDIFDDQWSYSWEVPEYYNDGEYTITVTGNDFAGNSGTDSIKIKVEAPAEPDKDDGFLGLPGFDGWLVIITILGLGIISNKMNNRKSKRY